MPVMAQQLHGAWRQRFLVLVRSADPTAPRQVELSLNSEHSTLESLWNRVESSGLGNRASHVLIGTTCKAVITNAGCKGNP